MTRMNRYGWLALTLALTALLAGCRPTVTGKNVAPDNPDLSAGERRQAMTQWHKLHDKRPN